MSKQNYNLWMTFGENQFFPDVSDVRVAWSAND